MMLILKIMSVLLVIVVALLLFAATRPGTIRVERSITIDSPAEEIFPLINDFHNWESWAPQDTEDPTMHRAYSGTASGVGAVSEWSGSGSTGQGRMFITKSITPAVVSVQADWQKPFKARNINEFVLEPNGNATKVTWTMQGTNVYLMKVMGLFVNMDRSMGKHFETGLRNLKAVAEQRRQ